jgi:phosphomannomutase/phosphoglucomutase
MVSPEFREGSKSTWETTSPLTSAIYTSCRIVRLVAESGRKISDLLSGVEAFYSTPETRIDCPDGVKFQVVDKLKAYFAQHYDIIDVDGVRMLFGDGWGLVRASNTQPVLVVRFKAKTPERLREIQDTALGTLQEIAPVKLSAQLH